MSLTIILALYSIFITLYAMGISIGSGEEIEKKDNTIQYLQDQLSDALKRLEKEEK